jgi:hypothetical protein
MFYLAFVFISHQLPKKGRFFSAAAAIYQHERLCPEQMFNVPFFFAGFSESSQTGGMDKNHPPYGHSVIRGF